ncbi:hypothetical protein BV898_05754 [Hypsibius exemplaris]|uniref:Uncharacterized protein n=1 Tax=Hypsibius exemplaris TaxID=2072580 RepID=A0A1W0WYC0_HYPEX|nr:hypothetical protein BV898_05754 [Hypsibius exemplaris]
MNEVKKEGAEDDERQQEGVVEGSECDSALSAGKSEGGAFSQTNGCTVEGGMDGGSALKTAGVFDYETEKPIGFDALLDSQQHFPEESVSSEEEAKAKRREADKKLGLVEIPEIHQKRHSTSTLSPSWTAQKPNVPMKPYVPYPEEKQPFPIIDEDEVVEMVKNSYGSRPAMTLRVAVRDMERLPEELEKFDNVHYLQKKVIEERIYRQAKKASVSEENTDVKPITRYSFGFNSKKPRNRRITAVGTMFDVKTRRHCRYGAWYLRRATWRKMDASEEIKKPGGQESDEAFERVTGQKRLHAVDLTLPRETSDHSNTTDVSHLHTAKEFYKLLRSRGRPIPAWLRCCEGALLQTEEAGRTAPFGSEVWREVREERNEQRACQTPGTPVDSLLRTDHYCYDSGYIKPDHPMKRQSEDGFQGGIMPECYAFLEELEQGIVTDEGSTH